MFLLFSELPYYCDVILTSSLCLLLSELPYVTSRLWRHGIVTSFVTSSLCLLLLELLSAMNRSVDPCEDFFQYTCGQWLVKNPIPESKSSWSQFRVLYQRNEVVMRLLITSEDTRKQYKEVSAARRTSDVIQPDWWRHGLRRHTLLWFHQYFHKTFLLCYIAKHDWWKSKHCL